MGDTIFLVYMLRVCVEARSVWWVWFWLGLYLHKGEASRVSCECLVSLCAVYLILVPGTADECGGRCSDLSFLEYVLILDMPSVSANFCWCAMPRVMCG